MKQSRRNQGREIELPKFCFLRKYGRAANVVASNGLESDNKATIETLKNRNFKETVISYFSIRYCFNGFSV